MRNDAKVPQALTMEPDVCDCCGGPRDKVRLVLGIQACPCTRFFHYEMGVIGADHPSFLYGTDPYGQAVCRCQTCSRCLTHCGCVHGYEIREAACIVRMEAEQCWE
jgi:hypothetical protein